MVEQPRRYLRSRFIRSRTQLVRCCADPNFSNLKILGPNLAMGFLRSPQIRLNKPWSAGMTILDRAKCFMYDQYYSHVRPAFPHATMLLTDTDSFVLRIVFELSRGEERALADGDGDELVMLRAFHRAFGQRLDTSNYPKDSVFYSDARKATPGYFKDEMCGQLIMRFIALRAKCYAVKVNDRRANKVVAKGVRYGARKTIQFDAFARCLRERRLAYVRQQQLISRDHRIRLARQQKLALSPFDDKVYLLSCGIHSVPYGHHAIDAGVPCEICSPK